MTALGPPESKSQAVANTVSGIVGCLLQEPYGPALNKLATQFYFAHDTRQKKEFDDIVIQLSEDKELKQQITKLNTLDFQTVARQAYSWDPRVSTEPFRQKDILNFHEVVPALSLKGVLTSQVLPERVNANLHYYLINAAVLVNYQLLFAPPIQAEKAIIFDEEEEKLINTSSEALIKFDVALSSDVFGDNNGNVIREEINEILSEAQEAETIEARKAVWKKLNVFCNKVDDFYKPYSLLVQYERENNNAALKDRDSLQQLVATDLGEAIADIKKAAQKFSYDDRYFTTLAVKTRDAVKRYKKQCDILETNSNSVSRINRQRRSRLWYLFTAACIGMGGVGIVGILFSPELAAGLGNISFAVGLPLAVLGIAVAFFAKGGSWTRKERSIVAFSCFAVGFTGGISALPELTEIATLLAPWLAVTAILIGIVVTRNTYTHNDELDERLHEEVNADYNSIQNISVVKKGLGESEIDSALAFSGNKEVKEQHVQNEAVPLLASSASTSFDLSQSIAQISDNSTTFPNYAGNEGNEEQPSNKLD